MSGEWDLRTAIAAAGGRFSPAGAVGVIEQVAAALHAARQAGWVRTVTPSNILISGPAFGYPGEVGTTRLVDIDPTGDTAAYVAPECVSGAGDSRADVYSLACVLAECLTGRPPSPAANPVEPAAADVPALPPGFDEVIRRGTANNPEERFQSTTELAAAARSALGGSYGACPDPHYPPQPYPGFAGYPGFTGWPPPGPAPRSALGRAAPALLAILMVILVGGYALFGFLTREAWLGGSPREGVRVTLSAKLSDGSPAAADALSQARTVVDDRLRALGVTGAGVVVEGSNLIATAPGDDTEVRTAIRPAQIRMRPVIRAVPVAQLRSKDDPHGSTPATPGPAQPSDEQVSFSKQLRQTTNPTIQLLALSYVAAHCDEEDQLAGRDNPRLPLVTCSSDGKTAYLLDKAILGGENVTAATAGFDKQNGHNVIDLQFTPDAAKRWASFTAANVGAQVAFAVDARVISAPQILEQIPGGRTQISGTFSDAQARELAAALQTRPLPLILSVASSTSEMVPGQPASTPMRVAMIIAGALVALFVIGATAYLAMRRYPRSVDQAHRQAAEVTRYTS